MKSLLKVLLANRVGNDVKMAWIPLPLRRVPHVINPLVYRLGIGDELENCEDEFIAYRSALGVTPDTDMHISYVEEILDGLSKFTPEQLECLKMMLRVFNMKFSDIDRFLVFLQMTNINDEENYCNE